MIYFVGRILMKSSYPLEACGFFQKALRNDPTDAEVENDLNRAKSLLVERWHYRMLNDVKRNSSYRDAIFQIVQKDDQVLDVGCGTGLLTVYALQAGARRVLACDSSIPMFRMAREAFRQNKFENVAIVRSSSTTIDMKAFGERFTVLIAEIFDAGLFGEGALRSLLDANKRLLTPTGKMIPMRANLYMCAIRSETIAKKYRFVHSKNHHILSQLKFNVNVLENIREPYDTEDLSIIKDLKYVTSVEKVLSVDFRDVSQLEELISEKGVSKNISFEILEKGKIDAFVMWFDMNLTEDVVITTDPRSADRCTAWDTAVFHIPKVYTFEKAKEKLSIDMRWYKGLVELIEKRSDVEDIVPVSKAIVRILNDTDYVNSLIGALGASCIHLSQLYSFDAVSVLDYTPFPIAGLLMLMRGAHKLVCCVKCEELVTRLAKDNDVDLDRISFIEEFDHNEKYEMVINYFIEPLGFLRKSDIIMARVMKMQVLERKGISMPFGIKMCAKLLFSNHLNITNRVNNHNLFKVSKESQVKSGESQYDISMYINNYQVTQNSVRPSVEFEKEFLSDEIVVFGQCLKPYDSDIVQAVVSRDGFVNAIQVYYKIELISNAEEVSTDKVDSHVNITYHLIDPAFSVKEGDRVNILVFSENNKFVKMVLDEDSN